LVQRPAVAARRRQPGRGVARLGALPAREAPALADRSVGDVTFDAEGSFPEAGGALMHGCVRQRESDVSDVTLPFCGSAPSPGGWSGYVHIVERGSGIWTPSAGIEEV